MAPKSISEIVREHRPEINEYISLYQHFHRTPELSFLEAQTAGDIIARLRKIGSYEIFPSIGSHGLAAVLRNNPDSLADTTTVLLRADIDGLPVEESTGLPYASTKRMRDSDDVEKPVMHACGHDMHITTLLACASLLLSARDHWRGTLILVFQPAEERGAGAQMMVDGGLYDKVPIPDVVLGGHVMPFRAGSLGTRRGLVACAADSFHVTLHGRQSHASQPHRSVDPVVLAASTVMRLQGVVSREVDPQKSAVVTVASVKAGEAENIIPDRAELKLNIRNYDPETRKQVLGSVRRVVDAECLASGTEKKAEWKDLSNFPFAYNDADVTEKLEQSFAEHFGTGKGQYDSQALPLGGSEDFPILATSIHKPSCFWTYGGVDPKLWDEVESRGALNEEIPINHSPFFAPVIEPTLSAGMEAYAVAALTWLAMR